MLYISPQATKNLNLKSLGKKNIVVKTFSNVKALKNLDMVQFAVKSKDENLNIYINAFVSDICYPVGYQQIDLAKQTYSHLQSLDLVDSNPHNLPLDIDILIGANHYWNIIGKHQVRGEYGPVALGSKPGYVLCGPIENSQSNVTSNNIVSTHFMHVETEFINSDFISNQNIRNSGADPGLTLGCCKIYKKIQ